MLKASFHFCTTRGGMNSSSTFDYKNRFGVWFESVFKKKKSTAATPSFLNPSPASLTLVSWQLRQGFRCVLSSSSSSSSASQAPTRSRLKRSSKLGSDYLLTSCVCIFKPCLPISSDATSFAAAKAFIKTFHICIDSPTNCKQTFICKIRINSARINKLVLFSLPERSWKERRSRNVKKVHTDYFQNIDFVLALLWAFWLTRGRAEMCGGGSGEGWTKQRDAIHHSWEAGKSCHDSDSHPLCCIMGSLFANP